jgi:hypothetical protein
MGKKDNERPVLLRSNYQIQSNDDKDASDGEFNEFGFHHNGVVLAAYR